MPAKTPSIITIIPARGGSKGLHRKCLQHVAGVPLLQRAISTASASRLPAPIYVSTDDPEFAKLATAWGAEVPFLRPAELATDSSSTIDAVLHFLTAIATPLPDWVLVIQPTTPLLEAADIDGAISLLQDDIDAVTSVCLTEVNPDWLRRPDADGWLEPAVELDVQQHTPRQLMPPTYRLNGALYFCRTAIFLQQKTLLPKKTVPYVMPQERSIDIDNLFDLKLANAIHELLIEP